MVSLAVENNAHFLTSRVDVDREAPSFTVDTLSLIQEREGPDTELFFIIGWDSLAHLHEWYRPDEIVSLAQIAAVTRPGSEADLERIKGLVPGLSRALHVIDTVHIGISSTDIRERIRLGWPIRYHVPPPVAEYIERVLDEKRAGLT